MPPSTEFPFPITVPHTAPIEVVVRNGDRRKTLRVAAHTISTEWFVRDELAERDADPVLIGLDAARLAEGWAVDVVHHALPDEAA